MKPHLIENARLRTGAMLDFHDASAEEGVKVRSTVAVQVLGDVEDSDTEQLYEFALTPAAAIQIGTELIQVAECAQQNAALVPLLLGDPKDPNYALAMQILDGISQHRKDGAQEVEVRPGLLTEEEVRAKRPTSR